MDSLVAQIVENFKAAYGLKITDSGDLFLSERNMLEFLMKLGRQAMGEVFQGMGNGYEGAVIHKEGWKYRVRRLPHDESARAVWDDRLQAGVLLQR